MFIHADMNQMVNITIYSQVRALWALLIYQEKKSIL